jgi:hypothetical protein
MTVRQYSDDLTSCLLFFLHVCISRDWVKKFGAKVGKCETRFDIAFGVPNIANEKKSPTGKFATLVDQISRNLARTMVHKIS